MSNVTCSVSPVVSHDTSSLDAQNASIAQPSAATPDLGLLDTVAKFAAPANELVQLEIDCKNWEATELAAAHARLYQLMTRAYSYYLIMKTDADKKKRDDYKKALATFIELRNYKFLSTSDDMHRVVKAVFGSDRRRVSAYSIALKTALASGVRAADLASWLIAQGGVEEVRSAKNSTNTDQTPDHEKAATSLADQVLMRIKPGRVPPRGVAAGRQPDAREARSP